MVDKLSQILLFQRFIQVAGTFRNTARLPGRFAGPRGEKEHESSWFPIKDILQPHSENGVWRWHQHYQTVPKTHAEWLWEDQGHVAQLQSPTWSHLQPAQTFCITHGPWWTEAGPGPENIDREADPATFKGFSHMPISPSIQHYHYCQLRDPTSFSQSAQALGTDSVTGLDPACQQPQPARWWKETRCVALLCGTWGTQRRGACFLPLGV